VRISKQNSLLRRHARGKRPLPEEIVEAATLESCRFRRNEHCGTFFALWSLLYPQSPSLQDALSATRKQGSEASRYLNPRGLAALMVLLGGSESDAAKVYSAAEAERLTGLFRRHYHHVVPFSRDRLDRIWDRCRGEDCEKRRTRAEMEIGIPHGGFRAEVGGLSQRRDPERVSRTALSSIVDLPNPPTRRLVVR
jgi:hypothetical protein